MRRLVYAASSMAMSSFAFAATKAAPAPDMPSQIMSGFSTIMAGSLGLKLAVVIIFVAGFAVGWWKEAHGAF